MHHWIFGLMMLGSTLAGFILHRPDEDGAGSGKWPAMSSGKVWLSVLWPCLLS